MSESVSRLFDEKTQAIATELDITPETEVFRFLHPVMIWKRDGDYVYLKGTQTSNARVTDKYQIPEKSLRASELKSPGLNLSIRSAELYQDPSKRFLVGVKMQDQDTSLKIYPDTGSGARSVYFTLPEGKLFKARVIEGNNEEADIAAKIHDDMARLGVTEEPMSSLYPGKDPFFRVNIYRGRQKTQVDFYKRGTFYAVESKAKLDEPTIMLAARRVLLDNMDMEKIFTDDKNYTRQEILSY